MRINDRYEIVSDDLNVILKRRNKKEDGTWSNYVSIGYYTDFKAALQSMIKKEILGTGFKEFSDICDKIEELTELVANI